MKLKILKEEKKKTLKESPSETACSQNQAQMERSTRCPESCFSSTTSLHMESNSNSKLQ